MNRIKELRELKKMGQKELAEKLGLTQQAISLYETGNREPKLKTWKKLANFFDVPVSYLRGEINDSDIEWMVYQLEKPISISTETHYSFKRPQDIGWKTYTQILNYLNQLVLVRSINNYLDNKKHDKVIYKPLNKDGLDLEYLKNNFAFIFMSTKSNNDYIKKLLLDDSGLSGEESFSTVAYIESTIDNEIKKELSKYSKKEYFDVLKKLLNDMTFEEAKRGERFDIWLEVEKRIVKN